VPVVAAKPRRLPSTNIVPVWLTMVNGSAGTCGRRSIAPASRIPMSVD
jgi:hypothetical protein